MEGNEAEAPNDIYLELFELIGENATLKLFKYFRSNKIDCPIKLYWTEYIADLAKQTDDRRESAKLQEREVILPSLSRWYCVSGKMRLKKTKKTIA